MTAIKSRAKREGWLNCIRSEADERACLDGYYFCRRSAAHCTEFFPRFLRHAKNRFAGKPFELLDWQREDLIEPLFGWMRPNGLRRFTKSYVEIPKKNGKSTLAAGLGIYMLAFDGEPGAKCFSAATDKDQAKLVHGEAIAMINASERLSSVLRVNRSTNHVFYDRLNCEYSALSNVVESKEGLDGHCAIIDELHAWKGYALWDCLKYMGRARDQPLLFVITTAGEDQEGVCWDYHDYCRKVERGEIVDHRQFSLIYSVSEEELKGDGKTGTPWDGLLNPEYHKRANPSYGYTINADEFLADMKEARANPRQIPRALRYGFNVWTRTESSGLPAGSHEANLEEYTAEDLAGRPCRAGLDLAKVFDLSALSLMFRDEDEDELYRRLNYFFMPESRVWDLRDKVDFRTWSENPRNNLVITPGDVCDYSLILAKWEELAELYEIDKLAFDPWNAEHVTQEMEAATGCERQEFRQTMANYAEPTEEYERLLRLGRMRHNGNQVIGWQSSHVQFSTDSSGNIRPVKPKREDVLQRHKTIDGVCADIMALGLWITEPPPDEGAAIMIM
ncbi:terminase large subunit [uncultured Maricaulis sp.]|uniref:terminase large subunit n=1 Tax=uncultured Maricaulis sp. TaxID=174710 RepID=UPI0030D70D57